jgi:hypothetical protein
LDCGNDHNCFEILDVRHKERDFLCFFLLTSNIFCLAGKELTADGREDGEVAETSVMVQDGLDNNGVPHPAVEEQDPLADFLPSPPHTPCSDELQVCLCMHLS